MARTTATPAVPATTIPAEILDDEITDADRERYQAYYAEHFPQLTSLLRAGRN